MRVELQSHHVPTGKTKHQLVGSGGAQDFPPFKRLAICQYAGDPGFYLMYYPESGHGTDTWHTTLEDALHQAEFEFRVTPSEWIRVASA